jgi:two-component system sensor histidine kinase ChiS
MGKSIKNISLMVETFIFGVTFIMGLYYAGTYWSRRKEKANLYFAIFCILISIRTAVVGERIFGIFIPNINWEIFQKISYLSVYAVPPIFIMFLRKIFPDEVSKKFSMMISFICSILCLIIIFTPNRIYDITLMLFETMVAAALVHSFKSLR